MKLLRKIWDTITEPFIGIAMILYYSRDIEEDDIDNPWAEYNRKRNEREMRKESKNK